MRRHNKAKKPKQYDGNVRRLLAKESSKRKKLEALGIDYDFPGYVRIPFSIPLPSSRLQLYSFLLSSQAVQVRPKGQHVKFD